MKHGSRSIVALFGFASVACTAAHSRPSPPSEPPLVIVYHQPFPEFCPAVDPSDTYWEGWGQSDEKGSAQTGIKLPPEFEFIRATLFGVWEGNGTGCLRVDVKSPPESQAVNAVDLPWILAGLVRRDPSVVYEFGPVPPNVIYSIGIPVRCTASDRDDCVRGKVKVTDVALAPDGSRVRHTLGRESEVGVRSGRGTRVSSP